jgi:hypothetical protein
MVVKDFAVINNRFLTGDTDKKMNSEEGSPMPNCTDTLIQSQLR